MSESQSSPRLSVSFSPGLSFSGAVKIMDCHAKWPDTTEQRGCLGGEGVVVGLWFGRWGRGVFKRAAGRTVWRAAYASKSIHSLLGSRDNNEMGHYRFDSEIMYHWFRSLHHLVQQMTFRIAAAAHRNLILAAQALGKSDLFPVDGRFWYLTIHLLWFGPNCGSCNFIVIVR